MGNVISMVETQIGIKTQKPYLQWGDPSSLLTVRGTVMPPKQGDYLQDILIISHGLLITLKNGLSDLNLP